MQMIFAVCIEVFFVPEVRNLEVGRAPWRAVNVSINGLSLGMLIIHSDIGQR